MSERRRIQPDDEDLDELLTDVKSTAEEICDEAWHECASEHILPSRLIELAFGLAASTAVETNHLNTCEGCFRRFGAYVPPSGPPGGASDSDRRSTRPKTDGDTRLRSRSDVHGRGGADTTNSIASDTIPYLLRNVCCISGPVIFPGEQVAFESWQFGRLLRLKQAGDDQATRAWELLCNRGLEVIRAMLEENFPSCVLVCFGRAMHQCGVQIAAQLDGSGVSPPHVVLANDYFGPKLRCHPSELRDAVVIVLVDVMHTGGLLKRVATMCKQYSPRCILGLAAIEQGSGQDVGIEYRSLWKGTCEERFPLSEYIARNSSKGLRQLRLFDPNAARALKSWTATEKNERHRPLARRNDVIDPELLEAMRYTDAMKRDLVIAGKRYPFAVDVLDLVREDSRSESITLSRAQPGRRL